MTTNNIAGLPREAARALEIELPKRVSGIENVCYWQKGEQFGLRRVYINATSGSKCWFDLDHVEIEGDKNEELERACNAILSPWLEKLAEIEDDPIF